MFYLLFSLPRLYTRHFNSAVTALEVHPTVKTLKWIKSEFELLKNKMHTLGDFVSADWSVSVNWKKRKRKQRNRKKKILITLSQVEKSNIWLSLKDELSGYKDSSKSLEEEHSVREWPFWSTAVQVNCSPWAVPLCECLRLSNLEVEY